MKTYIAVGLVILVLVGAIGFNVVKILARDNGVNAAWTTGAIAGDCCGTSANVVPAPDADIFPCH